MATSVRIAHEARAEARYKLLRSALIRSVVHAEPPRPIPEPIRNMVLAAPRFAAGEIAAMALVCCRWGELPTIDWAHVKRYQRGRVTMPKVGRTRKFQLPEGVGRSAWRAVRVPVLLPFRSREQAARGVRTALKWMDMRPPRGVKSGTHLVRHLTASAMHWAGCPVEAIASRLGHAVESSTAAYIHNRAAWRAA